MQRLREPGNFVKSYKGDRALRTVYEVDSAPLGEGRYSRVYGATHRSTGARRAIKTADRQGAWTQYVDLGMECPGRLALHEAEILRRLDHPNVIRIIEVFEEKKSVHLVLELCEGGDVLERILVSSGRLPETDIAALFIQMLFAVWHLHQNGVVHRDLKPEHFLFTRREPEIEPRPPMKATMKLIDFGLSHRIGVGFAPEGGTPQFMSPEAKVGKGTRESADRGDMWSLGVVLHAMLVGHYPSPHLTDAKITQYFSRRAWSGVSAPGIDFLSSLLRQQPGARPSAADALKHPWAQAAISASIVPPEPLLRTTAAAIKSYGAANVLRRVVLAAVARETDDRDIIGLRHVLQILELRCEGKMARSALLRPAGAEGALGEAATAFFRSFDVIVDKGGSDFIWTDLLAVFICGGAAAKGGADSSVPAIQEQACWRAFDLLSGGTGSVSAASLGQLLQQSSADAAPQKAQGIDSAGLRRIIQEVFSSGTISYPDFARLARGEVSCGAMAFMLKQLPRCRFSCCLCGKASSSGADGAASHKDRSSSVVQTMSVSPPPSIATPAENSLPVLPVPAIRGVECAEDPSPGASPTSSCKKKKKKRRPLSILGMTSL